MALAWGTRSQYCWLPSLPPSRLGGGRIIDPERRARSGGSEPDIAVRPARAQRHNQPGGHASEHVGQRVHGLDQDGDGDDEHVADSQARDYGPGRAVRRAQRGGQQRDKGRRRHRGVTGREQERPVAFPLAVHDLSEQDSTVKVAGSAARESTIRSR